MPVGEAPHRAIEQDPGREERFELCRLAAEGVDWLTASRTEVDRAGPTYTVDTLELRAGSPGASCSSCSGRTRRCDSREWHEPERVLRARDACDRASGRERPIEDVSARL